MLTPGRSSLPSTIAASPEASLSLASEFTGGIPRNIGSTMCGDGMPGICGKMKDVF